MARPPSTNATGRGTLSRDVVLRTAVRIADDGGIKSLTMRRLAQELGVEPMSLYHHVADKEAVLDGMVEVVLGEINERVSEVVASDDGDWKAALRKRILTARDVLLGHRWAPGVLESRKNMSPEALRYADDVSGLMRRGGFSVSLLHHAMHALGSRAFGFSQELFSQEDDAEVDPEVMAMMMGQMAEQYPYITEVVAIESGKHDEDSTLGWCDDQTEFEFGLDLLLDGLERLRDAELARTPEANGQP
jgi:AcrR family transcriptional regulator